MISYGIWNMISDENVRRIQWVLMIDSKADLRGWKLTESSTDWKDPEVFLQIVSKIIESDSLAMPYAMMWSFTKMGSSKSNKSERKMSNYR